MIKLRTSFFAFVISFFFINSSSHASYSMTELEATALDVPDTVNAVVWDNTDTGYPDDDDKQTVSIGFPFQFDTVQYNDVTILTNGILKFGAVERMHRDYRNEELDSNEGDRFIAVYWDDLVDDASSSVTYGSSGSAPDRKFIVNWTNVKAYSNNLRYDFQVVLYENGDIRYRYNNNTSNGESATIGLEINDSDFIQYSYNQISVAVSFDLLFRNLLLTLPSPVAQYRFDEISWDSSLDEVVDSTLNNLHGRSFSGANTDNTLPALGTTIGTCNYGTFDGTNDYVEIADNNTLDFSNNFSVGAWIKIDAIPSSGLKTILSKDENYEFHVNSSGQINWWWRTSILNQERQFNSTGTISPDTWHHIVISYRTGEQTIFIDGNESGSVNHFENALNNNLPIDVDFNDINHTEIDEKFVLGGLNAALFLPLNISHNHPVVMVFASAQKNYSAEHIEFLTNIAATVSHVLEKTVVVENLVSAAFSGLAKLAESRDPETGDHLTRMALYSAVIAEELASKGAYTELITPQYIRDVYNFAPMHDIGKVGISDDILLKPGRLDAKERQEMERHPTIGGEVLQKAEQQMQAMGHSIFTIGIEIAECHHEKFDGSGYPNQLRQTEIPLSARIVAVADVFDALTSKRPYKDAWPIEKALNLLEEESGKHFDPEVIAAMKKALPAIMEIYDRLKHV